MTSRKLSANPSTAEQNLRQANPLPRCMQCARLLPASLYRSDTPSTHIGFWRGEARPVTARTDAKQSRVEGKSLFSNSAYPLQSPNSPFSKNGAEPRCRFSHSSSWPGLICPGHAVGDGTKLAPTFRLCYWIMTPFMLQGARVKVRGKFCAPRLVVIGEAQVLVPAGSGGVPVGEPDRS
jgi:hypothetical protein